MSFLAEYWSVPSFRYAICAGVLVALLGSVVGFFIVLRRMAFVAVGVSHAALGGVAIGVLLHQSPLGWAIGFSILVALGMAALGRRGVSEDTAMGVFFPSAMAFGVIVIGFSQNWQRELLGYLFGDILAVGRSDLALLAVASAVILLLVGLFFKELMYVSFDEESAFASGVPLEPMRMLLLVIVAVTVVVSIKVVGVNLVSAMLVIPAAAATQLTCRWQGVLAGAALIGLASMFAGLGVSYAAPARYNLGTGPAAILVAAAVFALSTAYARLAARRSRAHANPPAPQPGTPLVAPA